MNQGIPLYSSKDTANLLDILAHTDKILYVCTSGHIIHKHREIIGKASIMDVNTKPYLDKVLASL